MAEVVLKITGDNSDAVRAISQVGDKMEEVGVTNKKNTDQYKSGAKQIVNSTKEVDNSMKSLNASVGNTIKNFLTIGLATAGLKSLATSVLNTRAEFQKFEAVLTNTLGSKSVAQQTLSRIQDFAAKTPFGVAELTSSFVKLANSGFKPTNDELTKLGDLAASQGKSFDMLTEAVIDAQTGEFERLKEFGIRAKTVGDNVTLSFKDQEVVVNKFNQGALRDAIVGFGALEGVAGGMAAISDTLGGKISNLNDNFDALLNNLGESSEGAFGAAIDGLNALLAASNETEKGINEINRALKDQGIEQTFFEKVSGQANKIAGVYKDYVDEAKKAATATNDYGSSIGALQKLNASLFKDYQDGTLTLREYELQTSVIKQGIKDLTAGSAEYTKELTKQIDKTVKLTDAQIKAADAARKKAAEDEKKLRKIIEDNAVDAIQNDQDREFAKAKLDYERKKKDIEDSKASQKTKNEALLSIDLEYANKKAEIENKYIDIQEKKDKEERDKKNKANEDDLEAALKLQDELLAESDKIESERLKKEKKNREDQIKALKTFFSKFGSELENFISNQISAQQDLLDSEQAAIDESKDAREDKISDLKSQLEGELELQRQGLANNVDAIREAIANEENARQASLDAEKKIKEEKKKLALEQIAIDTATQVSDLITASTEIYKSLAALGPIGVVGAIATIGLMIGSFISAKANAVKAVNSGFQKGGYTGDVGETEVAGSVHGKEFVSTAKTTKKHRNLLEALHSDDYSKLNMADLSPLLLGTGVTFSKEALTELRTDQANYSQRKANEPREMIDLMKKTNKNIGQFFTHYKNQPREKQNPDGSITTVIGNTKRTTRKK